MKNGQSIMTIAAAIEKEQEIKHDYHVDTRALKVEPTDDGMDITIDNSPGYALTELAEKQIAKHCHIPSGPGKGAAYRQYLKENDPEWLAETINRHMSRNKHTRLVRTLGDTGTNWVNPGGFDNGQHQWAADKPIARAFLSDQFPLRRDNYDMFQHVAPVIRDRNAIVKSAMLTDTRLYLKCVLPELSFALLDNGAIDPITDHEIEMIRQGAHKETERDLVIATAVITNSEVGLGSVGIEPGLARVWCYNLALASDRAMRKRHLAAKTTVGDMEVQAHHAADTVQAIDDAFWMSARDNFRAALDPDEFRKEALRFAASKEIKATAHFEVEDPVKVVEVTQERGNLTDTERGGILEHWFEEKDNSMYGLIQGITAYAGAVDSYDRSTELERLAHALLPE